MAGLRRYEPWGVLNQLQNEMEQLFGHDTDMRMRSTLSDSDWVPAVDVREEADKYVIHADVPGVDPKDIEVHLEKSVLTIKGERKHSMDEAAQGFKRSERVQGSFYRRFSLPESVDDDAVKATSAHGVLEITIPKAAAKAGSRKITVNGA